MPSSSFFSLRPGLGAATVVPALVLAACSVPLSRSRAPSLPEARPTQSGIASWYGPGFHGQPTASGAIYDQNDLTAAHQTLPLGTRVMVTNLTNGAAVEVTVNDRGPFAKGRIIDLSYAAARSIGMIGPGTAPVRIEVIDGGPEGVREIRQSLDYTLQLGSFSRRENAEQLRDRLATAFPDVAVVPLRLKDAVYYRVRMGTFPDRASAEEEARRLAQLGLPVVIMEK
ncbi:MAG TPA: septal ring lytic transglycosylase RlpA family protein [candidate division Zixibacteria bacterium]|nr:septal ring lytic transglycosylase RlpA family protein [candidate division Zixibacteria bacterium]